MKYLLLILCCASTVAAMENNEEDKKSGLRAFTESIQNLIRSNEHQLNIIEQALKSSSTGNEAITLYTPWRSTYDKSKSTLAPLSSSHCLFCEKLKKNPDELEETNRDKYFIVQTFDHGTLYALNQNPFIEGHSMLIPQKHIEHWEELSTKQKLEWIQVRTYGIALLRRLYNNENFNTYVNGGVIGGQSIKHIHENLLLRRHQGIVDIMGGIHIVSEWLATTHNKLKKPLSILQQKLHDGEDEFGIESLMDETK